MKASLIRSNRRKIIEFSKYGAAAVNPASGAPSPTQSRTKIFEVKETTSHNEIFPYSGRFYSYSAERRRMKLSPN